VARRTGWGDLSEPYKARLTRSAASGTLTGTPATSPRETARTYWQGGGDLRGARGHTRSRTPAPVREATQRSVAGESTTADSATLRRWRESSSPRWVPRSRGFLADDAAAALAQLPPPSRWGDVHFQPHGGGTWTMTVEGKGTAYDTTIELPDRVSARAVMSLLGGVGPGESWEGWKEWDRWNDERYDYDVAGTDEI
jgi:hypothetical protein